MLRYLPEVTYQGPNLAKYIKTCTSTITLKSEADPNLKDWSPGKYDFPLGASGMDGCGLLPYCHAKFWHGNLKKVYFDQRQCQLNGLEMQP